MPTATPSELTLSQIWNAQWLASPLRLIDDRELRVIYRGVWTHGLGPDFSNAYIDIDGQLLRGAVELHRSASDWFTHSHHLDPAYNEVVLHVVWQDDSREPVRRNDGATVPTLLLSDYLPGPLEDFAGNPTLRPLGAIGFDYCAPTVAAANPAALRNVWERAGDERMRLKTEAVAARLAGEPPAQTLYTLLLDALGYTRNREPMRAIAERLPYDHLDARLIGRDAEERFERAAGLLLGLAGFLPLSPHEQESAEVNPEQVVRVEHAWRTLGAAWRGIEVPPSSWTLARIRPAAHPIRRLLAMATILARLSDGLVEDFCARLEHNDAYGTLQDWLIEENRYLGRAHAHEVIVNVLVPCALAYGDLTEQADMTERATDLWAALPAGQGNAVIKRMVAQVCGDHQQRVRSARAEQGLLHLHATGCRAMRCFECPVAHLEILSTSLSSHG
jgi:hypothetical protein